MKIKYSDEFTSSPALILPVIISTIGKRSGKETKAIVDTGADISVIPEKLRKDLHLFPRSPVSIKGFFDRNYKDYATYYVRLFIKGFSSFEIKVISDELDFAVIGRDVLNKIILHANGPKKFFRLSK